MTTDHSSAARPGSAAVPVSERDREKRSRGSYRRQLTATRPGVPGAGTEAKRAAAVILEVLAGVRTPTAAAAALAIRLPRYYLLEQRAVQGLVSACEPRPRGRVMSADRRLGRLERELAVTRRELGRQQALARTTQRAVGLVATFSPASTVTSKVKGESGGPKRRQRKPSVRALRAARLLQTADSGSGTGPAAVQRAAGSPAVAAGGGIRPATTDASRS
jgi:hypothetical protein